MPASSSVSIFPGTPAISRSARASRRRACVGELVEQPAQLAVLLVGRLDRVGDRPVVRSARGGGSASASTRRDLLGAGGLVAGEHDDLAERRPQRPADRSGLRHRADRVRVAGLPAALGTGALALGGADDPAVERARLDAGDDTVAGLVRPVQATTGTTPSIPPRRRPALDGDVLVRR